MPVINTTTDAMIQQVVTTAAANNASDKAVGQLKELNPTVTVEEIQAVVTAVTTAVTNAITKQVYNVKAGR